MNLSRGGHAQLFFESAIAIPQLEGSTSAIAIPQLFKKCCSATVLPQFRNRNFFWSPQLQVRNLRPSLPQFSAYFSPWSGLKLYIFLTTRFFCYWDDFKGTVAQDFRPLFFVNQPIWTPESYAGQKSHATVPLMQVFYFHWNRRLYTLFLVDF